jgi:aspartyl/asparaginyl beta-hydroxylase (cupin superfamily)
MTDTAVRRVCRWDLADLCLEETSAHDLSLQALEDRLEEGLPDEHSVQYKLPADVLWTHARRAYRPAHSVLGILETMEREDEERSCRIHVYHITADDHASSVLEPPLHSDSGCLLSRFDADLRHGRACACPHPQYAASSSPSVPDAPPSVVEAPEEHIDWIDLFSVTTTAAVATSADDESSILFPTTRSVLHALRSLLGVDHGASPWVTDAPATHSSAASTMVLELQPSQVNERLTRFRVSDACPSWALHAVVPLCRCRMDWAPPGADEVSTSTTTLLIYKRLPPRDCLGRFHPETGEERPVPDCLWQSLVVKATDEATGLETSALQHRLVAPPYLDPRVHYPGLMEGLAAQLSVIRKEATEIAHWTAWPEQQHYQAVGDNGTPWNVFPLCYCFPAHAIENRQWIPTTNTCVPRTVEILRSVLGDTLRTALFSRLEPGAVLEAHSGWSDLANYVVRLHVPLVIPPGNLCGTWVDGCTATHTPDDDAWLCFDDSKIHRAFNYSTEPRIVLILDLERPTNWPRGTATGGHSEELDAFIQQMTAPR